MEKRKRLKSDGNALPDERSSLSAGVESEKNHAADSALREKPVSTNRFPQNNDACSTTVETTGKLGANLIAECLFTVLRAAAAIASVVFFDGLSNLFSSATRSLNVTPVGFGWPLENAPTNEIIGALPVATIGAIALLSCLVAVMRAANLINHGWINPATDDCSISASKAFNRLCNATTFVVSFTIAGPFANGVFLRLAGAVFFAGPQPFLPFSFESVIGFSSSCALLFSFVAVAVTMLESIVKATFSTVRTTVDHVRASSGERQCN